ncbi:MAG: GNAT family N-acetyltransferase [bacterium]|jgi:predicted N-acetyltransferase YhbS
MSEIHTRNMTEADFPQCQILREQARWNQTLEDWKRFLSYNPKGCFVAVNQSKVVGTVCTIAYQTFGWVAMVIVDTDHRRQGIGRDLLLKGIHHLESRGLTVKLDATPAGKLLYDTLGFADEYKVARYECRNPHAAIPGSSRDDALCELLDQNELNQLDAYDQRIFGNSRIQVLQSYLRLYPQHAYFRRRGEGISGYIMAREGVNAFHVGPWVADDPETAKALLYTCLVQRRAELVFIDIIEPNPYALPILAELGFTLQRPFVRMYKGNNSHPGEPQLVYSLSGPELG